LSSLKFIVIGFQSHLLHPETGKNTMAVIKIQQGRFETGNLFTLKNCPQVKHILTGRLPQLGLLKIKLMQRYHTTKLYSQTANCPFTVS
jgi:hypothetical protein